MNVITSNSDIKNFNLKIDDIEYEADDLLHILHRLEHQETKIDSTICNKLLDLKVVEITGTDLVRKSSNFNKFYTVVSKIYSKNIKNELKKKQLVAA